MTPIEIINQCEIEGRKPTPKEAAKLAQERTRLELLLERLRKLLAK